MSKITTNICDRCGTEFNEEGSMSIFRKPKFCIRVFGKNDPLIRAYGGIYKQGRCYDLCPKCHEELIQEFIGDEHYHPRPPVHPPIMK